MRNVETPSQGLPISRRRKLVFAGLIACGGLIAGAIVAEFLLRLYGTTDDRGRYEWVDDPILFYRMRAGVVEDGPTGRRSQTVQHLRGPAVFEKMPPPGTDRVLWVGDSACFGTGVDDAQTAAHQFQRLAGSVRPTESINLGVEGYNIRQIRETLIRRSVEFQGARLVVYYHHENDLVNAPWAEVAPFLPGGLYWEFEAPQPTIKLVLKRSVLARRLLNSWRRLSAPVPEVAGDRGANTDGRAGQMEDVPTRAVSEFTRTCTMLYQDESAYGRRFREELRLMRDRADAIGAEFVMVYWPSRTLLGSADLERLRAVLAQWCAEDGVKLVDVTHAFLADSSTELYFDTVHPGPTGQRIIAEEVLRVWSGGGR